MPLKDVDWHEIAGLAKADRLSAIRQELTRIGLPEVPRVAGIFSDLIGLPIFRIAADRVLRHLLRAGDPARALSALQDNIQNLEKSRGDASALLVDAILSLVLELAGASSKAAHLLSRDPLLAVELGARFDPLRGQADFDRMADRIVSQAGADLEVFDRLLRRFRNRQMLRIALRELRDVSVTETAAELADLASASLRAALAFHLPLLERQHGRPDPSCAHVVMGMGKLGGRELNFSSDIDLIYFYEHDQGRAGSLSLHEYHVKLFERITASLSRVTEHGFVFRVDLDLRPEGKPGPLANSLASAERYYQTWGRTWERAAWIRARPVAGDLRFGQQMIEMMRPFVYRRSFDLGAIEEIVAMKENIEAQRPRRVRKTIDLKLGAGGIRDIEFFAQGHQLLHGGRQPELRRTNTLETLQALEAAGIVSARVRQRMVEAYLLLRKVEHRVQLVEDRQTHDLPHDPAHLAALSRSLGFSSAQELLEELEPTMSEVRAHFLGMLGEVRGDLPLPEAILRALSPVLSEQERLDALTELGSDQPLAGLASIQAAARHPRSPFHPGADPRLFRLGAQFLRECQHSASFDRALLFLPDLVRSLIPQSALLRELEHADTRRGVARVLGASDLLARILVRSPDLLSHVLMGSPLVRLGEVSAEIEARVLASKDDIEEALLQLRMVKQEQILRTALAELAGVIEAEAAEQQLTDLAVLLIRAAFEQARKVVVERYGAPAADGGGGSRIAVIAGGTLGAREMSYRSDLDLSVVFEGRGRTSGGQRPGISTAEFFTRLVQLLLQYLTMRTEQGDLYPADLDLRPSGSQGPLVVSLDNLRAYHQKSAQLWERMALVRTRSVAGDAAFCAEVDAAISDAVYLTGLPPHAEATIRDMRQKMERERSAGRLRGEPATRLDLKLGRGGLVEVEFLVQYLLLQHGKEHLELRTTSTREAIRRLAAGGILEPEAASDLGQSYDHLRRTRSWLRLMRDELLDHVQLDPGSLAPLARAVGYQGESAARHLRRDLLAHTESIHRHYRAVLGDDSLHR